VITKTHRITNTCLSYHFIVREFACKDGTDKVLIDDALLEILEDLRFEFTRRYGDIYIRVGSGFRTRSYNTLIGGSAGSYYLYGMAADIDVVIREGGKEVDPNEVAKYLESKRVRGIGCYKYADGQVWVHVDSRQSKSFWRQSRPDVRLPVSTFWPTLREEILKPGEDYTFNMDVRVLQAAIGTKADGKFGPKSAEKLSVWQTAHGLAADSICGPVTWPAIFG